MKKAATDRLKVNPPLGRMPVLQFVMPGELAIDPAYQRSIEASDSQSLIRRIAQHWNWDLCQPLVVSRRADGTLYVIDGQHRLAAARLRGDIPQLPCVVGNYASAADEAASFVHLNQARRPLSRIAVFRAAVASGDRQALAIVDALDAAGLTLSASNNVEKWKPGQIANIGGIEKIWKQYGEPVARETLQCLSAAFAGEVLKYAGTLLPGIAAVCAGEMKGGASFEPGRLASFTAKLGARGQDTLRKDVLLESAAEPGLGHVAATVRVVTEMWWPERRKNRVSVERATAPLHERGMAAGKPTAAAVAVPAGVRFDEDGLTWCGQCDRRVGPAKVAACGDRFCSVRLRGVK